MKHGQFFASRFLALFVALTQPFRWCAPSQSDNRILMEGWHYKIAERVTHGKIIPPCDLIRFKFFRQKIFPRKFESFQITQSFWDRVIII